MSLRSNLDQAKLYNIKILHVTVNRKIFVFYNHNQTFIDIFNQLKTFFELTHTTNPDFLKPQAKFNQTRDEKLVPSDLIFSLFNMSLNRFESICTTFKNEAEKIQYNSDYAHENDRHD